MIGRFLQTKTSASSNVGRSNRLIRISHRLLLPALYCTHSPLIEDFSMAKSFCNGIGTSNAKACRTQLELRI